MKIAVVGGGIAGLGAAWALSQRHRVTVFEAADYLGGHANTRKVRVDGREVPVDTGFIVYNEVNYPQLTRLFSHISVDTEDSDMSFSVSLDRGRLEYDGSLRGIARPRNLVRPSYLIMLRDALRFYKSAPAILENDARHGDGRGHALLIFLAFSFNRQGIKFPQTLDGFQVTVYIIP